MRVETFRAIVKLTTYVLTATSMFNVAVHNYRHKMYQSIIIAKPSPEEEWTTQCMS